MQMTVIGHSGRIGGASSYDEALFFIEMTFME